MNMNCSVCGEKFSNTHDFICGECFSNFNSMILNGSYIMRNECSTRHKNVKIVNWKEEGF